jgi:N-acetylmuramoyl-L-alanine amidase
MKVISLKKEQLLMALYVVIILMGVLRAASMETVTAFSMPMSKKIILIDAGHGGWDPGMVEGGTLEKDINLKIAVKLQALLEQAGSYVLMTRAGDEALGDRKRFDMRNRKAIANNSKADMLISIHQNSFPQESAKGAQVFYYNQSGNSKLLAECVQSEIINFADPGNHRSAKANDSYYILKETSIPSVIVECGFLSNPGDKASLTTEEYQERVAWAIYKGIVNYYEGKGQQAPAS